METGQETRPPCCELSRMSINESRRGIDTANLISMARRTQSTPVDIIARMLRACTRKMVGGQPILKAGRRGCDWARSCRLQAGLTKLHRLGYTGAVTIERETLDAADRRCSPGEDLPRAYSQTNSNQLILGSRSMNRREFLVRLRPQQAAALEVQNCFWL